MSDPKRLSHRTSPHKAFQTAGELSRRRFLQGSVVTGAAALASRLDARTARSENRSEPAGTTAYTSCGVASGDPRPDSVVIWTWVPPSWQVASGSLAVSWEVSSTSTFASGTIVKSGGFSTDAGRDFTVKVKVSGLSPFTTYYYRFKTTSGFASVVGTTRTAPLATTNPESIRFAFISCNKYPVGYYNVLKTLATEDADFCVLLGDAIYETGGNGVRSDTIGEVQSNVATTLNDFRNKWKLYLSDANLQAARGRFPWIYIWDDHEVYNNFAGGDPTLPTADRDIQRAAYRAWSEYVPCDPDIVPVEVNGIATMKIYRSFQFGTMLEAWGLDGRQYRDPVVCGREAGTNGCDDTYATDRTMLGPEQLQWLLSGLGASSARWKILLNQTMMMGLKISNGIYPLMPRDAIFFETYDGYYANADQWDGYPAEREKILSLVQKNSIRNFMVVTGDIHNCYAGTLKVDFTDKKAAPVGIEIVGGSVTSDGIGDNTGSWDPTNVIFKALKPVNPHMVWIDEKYHVYTLLELSSTQCLVTYVGVDTILSETYSPFILAQFTIPDGVVSLIPGQQ